MIGIVFALLLAFQMSTSPDKLIEANASYRKGDFKSAVQIYRTLVQVDPKNEMAQSGLLRSLLRNENLEEANASAIEALKSLPGSSSVLSSMGDISFRMGNLSEAFEKYRRAIESDPRNGRAYLGMAKLYSSDFNQKSMRVMDRKAYENDPTDPEIIYAYATDLPAAEQIPLLERYLQVGSNEPEIRRSSARDQIAYLKVMGDQPTWVLNGEPRISTIGLHPITSARNERSGYRIKVSINGQKPIDLQLDTGACGLMIPRRLAERFGVRIMSESKLRGMGDEGERKSFVGVADSVRFGDVEFHDCRIQVSERNLLSNTQGLVGSDVFKQFLISLDLPRSQIRLAPLPLIQGRRYDDPESWEGLDRCSIPDLDGFMQVRRWGPLLLETHVNEKIRGYFFLDTGAFSNLISIELARKVTSVQASNASIMGVSGSVKDVGIARSVLLQAGRFRQQNDGIWAISFKKMSKDAGLEISGILGHPLLSQLIVVIDYRDGLLDLVYPRAMSK